MPSSPDKLISREFISTESKKTNLSILKEASISSKVPSAENLKILISAAVPESPSGKKLDFLTTRFPLTEKTITFDSVMENEIYPFFKEIELKTSISGTLKSAYINSIPEELNLTIASVVIPQNPLLK